jgi:GNAT superfamily N-acetyltransferase
MDVEWRSLQPSDVRGAFELSKIAGWNQTEADWHAYIGLASDGCIAVCVDGNLAGTAISFRYGDKVGWIGMLLVHPDCRRHGLGRELLRRSIRLLEGKRIRTIRLDATPMGRKVYLPLGFKDEYEVVRFEGFAGVFGAEESRALSARTMSIGDLPEAASLDARAFGVVRGDVLRALSSRDPELCFVAHARGKTEGFLIARKGREAIQLGPLVAMNAASAESLVMALFGAVPGQRIYVDMPAPNREGNAILARYGFRVQRSFTRMLLGDSGPPADMGLVFGTGGAEIG